MQITLRTERVCKAHPQLQVMEEPWHWPEAEEQVLYCDLKNQTARTELVKWIIYLKTVVKLW